MPTKTEVRPFLPSDAEVVSALIARTMRASNRNDYPLERLELLIAYFTPEKLRALALERVCLVALRDGVVIGTAAREQDELVTFFVDPRAQRHGVGTALLNQLEDGALVAGLRQLRVDSSVTGAGFYERHGYRRTGNPVAGSAGPQVSLLKEFDAHAG